MKRYEIKRKEGAPNVFGISLVKTPAMESDYVFLKKQEEVVKLSKEEKIKLSKESDVKLSVIDEKKRLLLGLVMEPDKDIYRYNPETNEEYWLSASAETILELQSDYIKASNQSNSTIEHDGNKLDGVTFTQHWIVEDSNIDKSALHGFSFKKGSWATVADITNDEVWNKYVTTGEVLGFSIDAMVHLEEVNLNKQEMSEQKTVLEFLKELPNKIALAMSDKKEGAKEVEKEVELAEVPEVEEAETPVEIEAQAENEQFDVEAFKQAMEEMGVSFATVVKDALKPIQDANIELKKEVETLKGEVVEMSKQPATKSIKSAPSQVDFSKMSELEKRKYYRQNG